MHELACQLTFLAVAISALGRPAASKQTVDFELENVPGFVPALGLPISDQFEADLGVEFSMTDGSLPTLGDVNARQGTGTTTEGWKFQGSNPPTFDVLAPTETTDIGSWFLVPSFGALLAGESLVIEYSTPTSAAGGDIIDIDQSLQIIDQFTIEALDSNRTVVDSTVLNPSDGGDARVARFSLSAPTAVIAEIRITYTGNSPDPGLAFDNFTPSSPAPPLVYCSAKTSSSGCATQIATSDRASAPVSGGSDYQVIATGVQELKNGLLFAGISGPASLPFGGGVLCVQPPTKRGSIMTSGGINPLGCAGGFSTLVNDGAIVPAGLDAGSGNSGWYQYWYRDPAGGAGQLGTALSNAVQLNFQ